MPSLGTTYHLIEKDDQQHNIYVASKTNVDVATYQMHTQTTIDKNKLEKRNINREGMKCKHFRENRYNMEGCFEKIGYLDWWKS